MKHSGAAGSSIDGATYRSLLQIALVGTELQEFSHSADIAETLRSLQPELPQASIVLAMNSFYAGKVESGIQELQDTLAEFPDSQLAKAILATCLQVNGLGGWQHMFEAVIDDGRDEQAVGLACQMLGRSNPMRASENAQSAESQPIAANAMWA
jgi:Bacterial type III secretion protein (HrpB1_HrpK)